jgi:predicted nucleotide-binding protein
MVGQYLVGLGGSPAKRNQHRGANSDLDAVGRQRALMKPQVFIASSVEGLAIAYAVQEGIEYDSEPTVWSQGVFDPTSFAIDDLIEKLTETDFGIFVFTPDDVSVVKNKRQKAIRDNVIFELGLFVGLLGRKRNFIVQPRNVKYLRWPTDLAGLNPLPFDMERRDGNVKAALGPACNQIREAMKKLGRVVQTVEQVEAELDEKCLSVMLFFGKVSYFSRPPATDFDGSVFDQGVARLRSLKCLRFELSADAKLYAYHWTDLGQLLLKKYNYDRTTTSHAATKPSKAAVATRASLSLSEKAQILLMNATKGDGTIMMIRDSGGLHIQANGQQFIEGHNPHLEAEWKAALEELLGHKFIESAGSRGEVFDVTAKGYKAAESLEGGA